MALRCSKSEFAAVALFFAGGLSLSAADTAAKSGGQDPIATAKQELEAIKASGARTPDSKSAIPATSLPTFEAKDDSRPSSLPAIGTRKLDERDELKVAGHSPNWLVDAMTEKQAKTDQDALRGSRGLGRSDASREDRWEAASPPHKGEGEITEEKDGVKEIAPGRVPNPLSGYMATWMTPHDFGLLYPKKPNEPADGFSTSLAGPSGGVVDAPSLGLLGDPLTTPSAPSAGTAISTPQPNPYIADATPSTGPSPVGLQPLLDAVKPAPAPRRAAAETGAAASAPAAPPSLRAPQSGDDAKYFKQLDRF